MCFSQGLLSKLNFKVFFIANFLIKEDRKLKFELLFLNVLAYDIVILAQGGIEICKTKCSGLTRFITSLILLILKQSAQPCSWKGSFTDGFEKCLYNIKSLVWAKANSLGFLTCWNCVYVLIKILLEIQQRKWKWKP